MSLTPGKRPAAGFTLLELIIVVIVIGILASVALPRYLNMMEKARAAEAKQMLADILRAQSRCYAQYARYTSNPAFLDIQGVTAGRYFTFSLYGVNNPASPSGPSIGPPFSGCNAGAVAAASRNTYQNIGSTYTFYIGSNGDVCCNASSGSCPD